MKAGKTVRILLVLCLALAMLAACSPGASGPSPSAAAQAMDKPLSLDGKTLFVYCGAGMKEPFSEIVKAFEKESGANVEVTYGNTAQLTSQITASGEGDLFIAGDKNDLAPIQDAYVAATKDLVKHIPVLAVQTGNPKEITGLAGLAKEGVTVVLGDNEATPIGKIADKALKDAGILHDVDVTARTTTAPEIATALSLGQCDAAIIWKENTNVDGVETVATTDMDKYIKTIPAASLKCSKNTEALEAFLTFLDTATAKGIWTNNGYELLH